MESFFITIFSARAIFPDCMCGSMGVPGSQLIGGVFSALDRRKMRAKRTLVSVRNGRTTRNNQPTNQHPAECARERERGSIVDQTNKGGHHHTAQILSLSFPRCCFCCCSDVRFISVNNHRCVLVSIPSEQSTSDCSCSRVSAQREKRLFAWLNGDEGRTGTSAACSARRCDRRREREREEGERKAGRRRGGEG